MTKKPIHPAHKTLRYFLYICLGLSVVFISTVVYLRMNYHHLRDNPALRDTIFQADIYQHQFYTVWGDDAEDLLIVRELFRKSFFSRIYRYAALDMLEDQAEEGYPPAQTLHADMILHYKHTDNPEQDAQHYYNLAAAQDYEPAIDKLSVLQP